ncbi:amidohydrolase [Hyphomonas adhaerens MHS-3]|uniref:Amidohydrolase n=1 Tax=Hyphomonas adhaerens MHS-3 TaxID=1280949 RepID=A0A069E0P9_9PROT|nr:amidohydrolase family protein [Hyphomonas adhaerens]KCZ82944.1 amidohydrolase [Hyphomonas adhaerens MHS-3]
MKHALMGAGAALAMAALVACASAPSPEPLAGDLLIRDVRTIGFEGETPAIREHAYVLVKDGKILAVRDTVEGLSAPDTVDGGGQTLVPGLTDMHVHIWDQAELGAYLSWGVTRVRNMSGLPFHLPLAKQIEAGEVMGPHLITTGPILNSPGPNAQINHQFVETADEARAAVTWQAEAGFDRIKVYSNLTRPAYEAIIEEAAARGMPVSGHTPEGVREDGMPMEKPFNIAFEEVLADHFETIEHIESVVWHGLRNRHDEDAARALARKIAIEDVPVTATLLAHRNLLLVAETDGAATTRPGTDILNAVEQQTEGENFAFWAGYDPAPVAEDAAFYARVADIFQQEGVMLLAGTDAGIFTNIPGKSLGEELLLLTGAGLSPYEALRSATYSPSVVLGTAGQDGCLEAGCVADLVLLPCDPLADIACATEPAGLIYRGAWLDRAALDALRTDAAVQNVDRTITNVMGGMAEYGVDVSALMED